MVRPEKASGKISNRFFNFYHWNQIGLPEVTRKLLLHTAQRTYGHLSQGDIRQEYVNQETRKEWTDFKKEILNDVMFKKNIRSGQGKWQHSTSKSTAERLTKSSMH